MGAPRSVIVAGALVVAAAAPRLDQELIQRAAAAVTPPSSLELATVSRATAMVVSNDNQRPAGRLRRHTLELRLVAQETEWRPDLEAPPVPIYALAEEGKAPTIPGPLLRVRAGTRVRVQVRNALAVPMLMRGLQDRPVEALDSVLIARGATHEFTFPPRHRGPTTTGDRRRRTDRGSRRGSMDSCWAPSSSIRLKDQYPPIASG